jgi:hypothetical protein
LYPGQDIAGALTREWSQRYQAPLAYVVGDTWLASNVHFYSPDRPSVFTEGDPNQAPYVDPAHVSQTGALLVWWIAESKEMPAHLRQKFPDAIEQPALSFSYRAGRQPPIRLGWAVLPPRAGR